MSTTPPHINKKKKHILVITLTIASFLLLLSCYAVYWYIWGRFEVYTNDAYVNGNMVSINPQISGILTQILVDNAQLVQEGQPIFELDRHDNQIAFERAKAVLAEAVREVARMFDDTERLKAVIKVEEAKLLRAQLDYEHRLHLVQKGGVSQEEFEHSQIHMSVVIATLMEAKAAWRAAADQIENTTIPTHPKVEEAKTEVKNRYLALERCTIYASVTGIATQRKGQVGESVTSSTPLLAIIPLDQMWVDANFREVQMKNIRIGQEVKITSDMYGRNIVFHGKVLGFNPGTGSVFSVLPPQNATGNWIKIVQRVPLRIQLDQQEIARFPLMLGLSLYVTVNIKNTDALRMPIEPILQQIQYQTNIFEKQLEGVEETIASIIEENMPHE